MSILEKKRGDDHQNFCFFFHVKFSSQLTTCIISYVLKRLNMALSMHLKFKRLKRTQAGFEPMPLVVVLALLMHSTNSI